MERLKIEESRYMSYRTPRSDNFYYIEVWDKQSLRNAKVNSLFGDDSHPIGFVSGSQQRLDIAKNIGHSIFWKTKETVEFRVKYLEEYNYTFVIKCLSRSEFIDVMVDGECSSRNAVIKMREIRYIKKKKM